MLSILHKVRAIIFTFFEVDNTWTSTYFSFNANLIKLIQEFHTFIKLKSAMLYNCKCDSLLCDEKF